MMIFDSYVSLKHLKPIIFVFDQMQRPMSPMTSHDTQPRHFVKEDVSATDLSERPPAVEKRGEKPLGEQCDICSVYGRWGWDETYHYKVVPQFGIAKLVSKSHFTMVYGRYNELVFMGFINQLITGGHHIVHIMTIFGGINIQLYQL